MPEEAKEAAPEPARQSPADEVAAGEVAAGEAAAGDRTTDPAATEERPAVAAAGPTGEQNAAEPSRAAGQAAGDAAAGAAGRPLSEKGSTEVDGTAERATNDGAEIPRTATQPSDTTDPAAPAAKGGPADGQGVAEREAADPPEGAYWWRRTVVSMVGGLFAAYLLYRILHDGRLEQSALFYVGLPAVIAIVVAGTARPRSAVGAAVVATTIGLALAGPLLGEGIICLVFAAPLFYLVAVFVGLIVEAARKAGHRGVTAVAIVPVLLMCLEGVSPETSMPRGETVVSERVVQARPADVERALAATPAYGRPTSAFLRIGFPRPLSATGRGLDVGDERFVRFTPRRSLGIGAEPTPRSMRLRVTESRPGRVVFTIVQDSTAARWLDFEEAEVAWHATGDAGTTVRWTLRYHRTFDPSWYFGPLQRYGMTRVADYLNVTITNPPAHA